jgi:acyl transferase domain-containing protein
MLARLAIPLPVLAKHRGAMRKLQQRESYRLAFSFLVVSKRVSDALRDKRPASIHRLNAAGMAIVHFICHSQRRRRKRNEWRIQRAVAAAAAAGAILQRLHAIDQHRVTVSAANEVLERLQAVLKQELEP